jgi:hypothetical protein
MITYFDEITDIIKLNISNTNKLTGITTDYWHIYFDNQCKGALVTAVRQNDNVIKFSMVPFGFMLSNQNVFYASPVLYNSMVKMTDKYNWLKSLSDIELNNLLYSGD